ncbi:hypothetical protein HNO89_003790 [Sporosarcina luteola]|nr:hypothetical protein [Sporosarcina luteola]
MLRYKKLFGICVLTVALSALIIPQPEYHFGWPLRWLNYYGTEPITSSAALFQPANVKHMYFDLWNLVIGALLLYFALILLYNMLSKVIGEQTGESKHD